MKRNRKTRIQTIRELDELRQQVDELDASKVDDPVKSQKASFYSVLGVRF